ncbi:MAG: amidohydrolase family protein [Pseudomonadota bacterium]|nr:amidohydrolase family protein [Pseudomonadota bacterium]
MRWSAGTEAPRTRAPANATDCHFHIYDPSFPAASYAKLLPPPASVSDYMALKRRLGITRSVLIQPSTYGTNNKAYLGLLPELGRDRTRMVAVVNTSVTDQELRGMHAAGVRGIRFNLAQAGATTLDMVEPLSARVDSMGWHCQINMPGEDIVAAKDVFLRVPGKLVFDHLAHVPEPAGVNSPTFALIRRLLDKGNTWVKLSGAYADTKVGPPTYADSSAVAKAYVQAAPQRLVWGSDWPHPTEAVTKKPDDALLFDLFASWMPDEATRHRILVENPAELYGFPAG